ncbi:MAG: hypothetical protein HY553_12075 [Elusimicrobia bacterium]|nr:hypothetical protein [Elusimicrobiota bacterium]
MILAFVRRSNDVDHLTPVVWALARGGERVDVLSVNPLLDIGEDYRLRFLASLPGVRVGDAYTAHAPTAAHRWVGRFLCAHRRHGERWRRLAVERLWDRVLLPRLYHAGWAEGLVARAGARTLLFDWVTPGKHVTAPLLAAAGRLGVPTFALPHGVSITTGELRTAAAARAGALPDYASALPFDCLVAPHHDQADYFARGGLPRDRIAVLGSARFCAEWVAEGLRIVPRTARLEGGGEGLKVVFMDKKSYSSRPAIVAETLRRLASLDFVRLVIKPQTRNDRFDLPVSDRVEIAADVASVRLVAWADVVIGTVSSILVEPLCQGTPLVYPSYHCAISTRLEEMDACWRVRDDHELESALRALARDRAAYPVAPDRVDRCLSEIVYASDPDRDVLGRYRRAILARIGTASRGAEGPARRHEVPA